MRIFTREETERAEKFVRDTRPSLNDSKVKLVTAKVLRALPKTIAMMSIKPSEKMEALVMANRLLEIPDDQYSAAKVAYAFECAWQMGYRKPEELCYMAQNFLKNELSR